MERIRIIHYSTISGNLEGVYFTEDLELDAEDVLPPHCTIDSDVEIDVINFPSGFPLDYNLERRAI